MKNTFNSHSHLKYINIGIINYLMKKSCWLQIGRVDACLSTRGPNNINNPKKEDKEVQTDEYNEEITPEQFDGDSGDINFAVISNKVNRFVFQTDEDLMKDDMFYRSEYEKVDINKVLQTETDNHLINLLQSSINFKDIPELTKRKFVVTDDENGELLWNDGNDLVDEMNNEYEIKYHSYNPEKYSTYLEYNWDNGLNSIL
ncbi:hypothetical protein TRFO_18989 [Tritrichomonas foetus]|uniref:Uncharacterized protein n=1 Tax=Tritrichomonas foetus TaxID=1144522 RepID=A0A1J4KJY9_9EUKA|nr:hypothetical protein TRFO_18989 [Tritrichomonas foetus]|eukprot:OHT11539.1 hypothetical protein TRFO_18989 [Tritrichomonas foetus]